MCLANRFGRVVVAGKYFPTVTNAVPQKVSEMKQRLKCVFASLQIILKHKSLMLDTRKTTIKF